MPHYIWMLLLFTALTQACAESSTNAMRQVAIRILRNVDEDLASAREYRNSMLAIDPRTTNVAEQAELETWKELQQFWEQRITDLKDSNYYYSLVRDGVLEETNEPLAREELLNITGVVLGHMLTSTKWNLRPTHAYFINLPEALSLEDIAPIPHQDVEINPSREFLPVQDVTLSISSVKVVKNGCVLVTASSYTAPEAAEGHKILLRKKGSRWSIDVDVLVWIS